jgi:hypothetical protein
MNRNLDRNSIEQIEQKEKGRNEMSQIVKDARRIDHVVGKLMKIFDAATKEQQVEIGQAIGTLLSAKARIGLVYTTAKQQNVRNEQIIHDFFGGMN